MPISKSAGRLKICHRRANPPTGDKSGWSKAENQL
jgi:hypothetical protein